MSRYVAVDDGPPAELASNTGWGDLSRWVDSLDESEFPQLIHLIEHGWCQQPDQLAGELDTAASDLPPTDDVAEIIDTLKAAADGAEIVCVTDGLQPDGGAEKGIRLPWREPLHPRNHGRFAEKPGPSMAKPSHISFVRTLQQARQRATQHAPAGGSGPAGPKVPPPPEGVTDELRGLAGDSSWPKVAHAFAKLYTAVFVKATELGMLTTKVAEAIGDTTEDYMTGRAGTYGSVDAWKGQTGVSWTTTMAVVRISIAAAFKAAGKGKEHEDIEAAVKLTVDVLNHVHETFGVQHEVDEDEVRELLAKRLGA